MRALEKAAQMIRISDDRRKEKNERVRSTHSLAAMLGKIRELYGQWGIKVPVMPQDSHRVTLRNGAKIETFKRLPLFRLLRIKRSEVFFREAVVLQEGVIGVGRRKEQPLFPVQEAASQESHVEKGEGRPQGQCGPQKGSLGLLDFESRQPAVALHSNQVIGDGSVRVVLQRVLEISGRSVHQNLFMDGTLLEAPDLFLKRRRQ